ncbi:hypothetical protein CANCADRAFT_28633 [Tortispora caseinolytica NRRL Y-17796]|uniref:V-type proton ATPase subunit H n=1 Tax=Tortispora caseinolytica NRRL Y-17796 TaxID=767744 RepID=A0A1E4TCN3_9ASCO|nr:hypothetical protein CANCADRAFT_28633 [Tortispora caseinolytica NRRL Y-17796]
MAVLTNPYLNEICSNIRARPVPWDGYIRTDVVSQADAELIKQIEKLSDEQKKAAVAASPLPYVKTTAALLTKTSRPDILQYALVLLSDLLDLSSDFSEAIYSSKSDKMELYAVLLPLLDHSDEHVWLTCSLATTAVLKDDPNPPKDVVEKFFSFNISQSKSTDANLKDLSVQIYGSIIQSQSIREQLWAASKSTIPPLISFLSAQSSIQLTYHTLMVFWILTFYPKASAELDEQFDIIPILLRTLKSAIKEKIARVCVAILVNMITLAPEKNQVVILSHHGLTLLRSLMNRKWSDPELQDDLETLIAHLEITEGELSSFDEYKIELDSGRLKWSPSHRSAEFWRSNAYKFKEQNWKYTHRLLEIILTSDDSTTLAVACNDIGFLIEQVPEVLRVIQQQNVKPRIMELMTHNDTDLRYEALKATQNLMQNSLKA